MDSDLEHPYPRIDPYASILGSLALGPKPNPDHAVYPLTEWDEELVQATANQGNPYEDYGHFRVWDSAVQPPQIVGEGNDPWAMTVPELQEAVELYGRSRVWQDRNVLRYQLMSPPPEAQMPEDGWPLVIYCPGVGAIGRMEISSSGRVSDELVWASSYFRKHYPAYVLVMHPQARATFYPNRFESLPTEVLEAYLDLTEHVLREYPVDRRRVYPIGFSHGGASVWQMLVSRPDLFAAAAPVAGRPFTVGDLDQAETIAHIPIWMFIGNEDTWSGSATYIRAFQDLKAVGADRVRLWEIQYLAHRSNALRSFHLAEWLFAQRAPIIPDTDPPQVLQAVRSGPDRIRILFDEPMDEGTDGTGAANPLNYDLGEGLEVSGAQLQADGRTVILEVPGMGENLLRVLEIAPLADRFDPPNLSESQQVPVQYTLTTTGYWPMDGGEEVVLHDWSGNERHASSALFPEWNEQGIKAGALQLSDKQERVALPVESLNPEAGTLMLWIRPETGVPNENAVLINHEASSSGTSRIHVGINETGGFVFGVAEQFPLESGVQMENRWHHLALTWESGSYHALVDGSVVASGEYVPFTTLGNHLMLGSLFNGNRGFKGLIDEVRLLNTAVPLEQVRAGWTALTDPQPSRAAMHFSRFESGTRMRVAVPTEIGYRYRVEHSAGLPNSGEWNPVPGIAFTGDGEVKVIRVPVEPETTASWYRILVE
jgi:dienelactone hydrolase